MSSRVRAAPAAKRIQAFLWDYLVMAGYIAVLVAVSAGLLYTPANAGWRWLFDHPVRADLLSFLLLILPVLLYFALSEASDRQATPGKRKVGLRVVDLRGKRVPPGRALLRNAFKFLPWQMAHTAMFNIPGFPMAPRDAPVWTTALLVCAWILVGAYLVGLTAAAGGRTPYDRLAGTVVVSGGETERHAV